MTYPKLDDSDLPLPSLREAFLDATANLMAAASAYERFACRSKAIGRRAQPDPFFTTRCHDFQAAAERASRVAREVFGATKREYADD